MTHSCQKCGKYFAEKYSLLQHVKEQHTDALPGVHLNYFVSILEIKPCIITRFGFFSLIQLYNLYVIFPKNMNAKTLDPYATKL